MKTNTFSKIEQCRLCFLPRFEGSLLQNITGVIFSYCRKNGILTTAKLGLK
ncbi:MAG: hypothetical protein R3E32_09425 [Chitinophagales bacterium]